MSRTKIAVLSVVGVLAIAGLVVGLYFAVWYSADPRGSLSAREQTRGSGSYRIASYDHYFDLCASIQAFEDRIENTQDEMNIEPGPSPTRLAQLQQNLTAQNNQRDSLIRQYNTDATKEGTRAPFRDDDLPYQIDPDNKETQCAA